MHRKICLITGANAGIGKQAAIQIAAKGYHVILACRDGERGRRALDELRKREPAASSELMLVDMSLRGSILKFVNEFKQKYERLDALIHNAALFSVTQKEREETEEGVETVWATNHIGPTLMTEALLDRLKKSENSRILTVSSKGLLAKPCLKVSLDDPEFKARRFNVVNAYYQSKLAQLLYTLWLAQRLNGSTVSTNCVRVPAVKIDLSRHPGLSPFMVWAYSLKAKRAISPEAMAETYTRLAVSDEFRESSGKYFDEKARELRLSSYSRDNGTIQAVIELTRRYVPEMEKL